MPDRVSTGELEHERHIFENHPRYVRRAKQAEDVIDEARLLAAKPLRQTGLRQVLARKPGDDEVHGAREPFQRRHIFVNRHLRKSVAENRNGSRLDLAEQLGVVAGASQAEFKTADAGEQAGDVKV
jgi:hypothetical protein